MITTARTIRTACCTVARYTATKHPSVQVNSSIIDRQKNINITTAAQFIERAKLQVVRLVQQLPKNDRSCDLRAKNVFDHVQNERSDCIPKKAAHFQHTGVSEISTPLNINPSGVRMLQNIITSKNEWKTLQKHLTFLRGTYTQTHPDVYGFYHRTTINFSRRETLILSDIADQNLLSCYFHVTLKVRLSQRP